MYRYVYIWIFTVKKESDINNINIYIQNIYLILLEGMIYIGDSSVFGESL